MYFRPSGQPITPVPSGRSCAASTSFQSPLYIRPSFHVIVPPLLDPSWVQAPTSFVPSENTSVPLVLYGLSSRHSPCKCVPFGSIHVPWPLRMLSLNSHTYCVPLEFVRVPVPFALPS